MKQNFKNFYKAKYRVLSLVLAFVMLVGMLPTTVFAAEGEPTELEGYYQIYNADQLKWFAEQVNSGSTSINGKLMNDIDLSGICGANINGAEVNWTPIGNKTNQFSGTFDGNGYEVKNLYINSTDEYQGLFGYNEGTIQNLGVSGDVKGDRYVGGVCGQLYSGTITNCYNTGTVSGYARVGGVCGEITIYAKITNCYNAGSVSGSSSYYIGGVCGNSYENTITNCYYLDSTATDSYATGKTAEQFKSGEVTYLLNNDVTDGTQAWYQTLGTNGDSYPVLDSTHGTVYGGYKSCADTEMTYANTPLNDSKPEHNYDNGFCSVCGGYEEPQKVSETHYSNLNATHSGYYAIENAGQLYWFAYMVINKNSDYRYANAVLTADIKVNDNVLTSEGKLNAESANTFRQWTPIGNYYNTYNGIFDGNGKTVSGLYCNDSSKNYVGLFGKTFTATIKQVGIIDSYFNGKDYVGGVCGLAVTIENSYNTGVVSGNNYVGGVCGYAVTIKNSYNTGDVSGNGNVGGVCGYSYENTITNCYYLADSETDSLDGTTFKTAAQFKSGEVAYFLQNGQTEGDDGTIPQVWGQNIDNGEPAQDYPVLGGATVYFSSAENRYSNYHIHSWTYTLNDAQDTITANCDNADGHCSNTAGGSVKLTPPTNAVYTGKAIEAVVENTLITGDSVDVVYAPEDQLTDGKPVNAGTYTASITLGDATASITFEIEKATPNLGTVSADGEVTDQMTPGGVTLTATNTTVAGTLSLTDSELLANKSEYNWQFVPDDTENYETVTGTVNIHVEDTQKPTAEISFKTHKWNQFLNTVTFGLFFKDTVEVTVTASDNENGSGVQTVEYLLSETVISDKSSLPMDGWKTLGSGDGTFTFNIAPNKKAYVYVRVTDNDSNMTVINSDGVVVYTDSTIAEENKEIRYTIGSESGVSASVSLNGNTVKEIKNGDTVLAAAAYTVYEDGKITFKANYLNSLDIGEYTLTVSFNPLGEEYKENEGNEAPATVTITLRVYKNLPENLVKQDETLTYNGTEQTPAVKATETADGKTIAYTYSTSEGGEYTADLPKFTNAGTYTVCYKANADYHNEGSGSFTVTVEKQTVTEPTIESKEYTGAKLTADVPASDRYTVTENNGGTNKGGYDVVLELKDSDNYKWKTTDDKTVTLTFNITAADNSWTTAPSIGNWTYGNTASTPAYDAKFGSVTVTYTGTAADGTDYSSTAAPTKAGTYTATFEVEATEDYGSLSLSVNFTIRPRKVTVTAEDAEKTYGDSDPEKFNWNVTSGNVMDGDDLGITVSRESGENAKTYRIVIDTANANPNYDITTVNGTFTINKAKLTVTADDKTATYGDEAPDYTVSYDGFKFIDNAESLGGTLAFDCEYEQFDDKGEYTITPKGYTSDNYDITYVDGKLTVNAKKITVTINKATSIYGDEIATLTATDNGIVNGDTNVYSLATTATKTSDVGKYSITGTALDDNYEITFTGGTDAYEITKRKLTVTVVVADKKYDGKNNAAIVSATLNNAANGDQIVLINGTATFETVDKANYIAIALTDFAISGDKVGNYTLIQPTGVRANITNGWNPSVNTEYTVSEPNANGWLNTDFVITAKDGYKVSLTNTANGEWKDSLVGAVEGESNSITFFVKNTADGTISEAAIENYKLDKVSPTGKVYLDERNSWQNFLNTITFGLFYKNEVTVKATAEDTLSGVDKIEYIESAKALTLDEVKAVTDWTVMNGNGVGVTLTDAKQFVYYVRITDKAGNVTYLSTDGAEYDTTAPAVSGAENGKTYYTTQKVTVTDKNLDTVTLDGEAVTGTVTLDGNKDATYTIVATDKAGNSTTVTVTMKPIATVEAPIDEMTESEVKSSDKETIENVLAQAEELLKDENLTEDEKKALEEVKTNAENLISKIEATADTAKDLTDTVGGYDAKTVTGDDKQDIKDLIDGIGTLLDGDNLTETERKALEDTKVEVEALLKQIDDAEKAANSETAETVKDVTAENVKPEDKTDLEQAKEDLEKALEEHGSNYTEDEKKAIEDEIKRIDEALEVIGNVENVEDLINKLPDTIKKTDADAIKAAEDAYNALSDYEKSLVDKDAKKALDDAKAALEKLNKPTNPNNPQTGDNSNIFLWIALLFISGGAVTVLTVSGKKRKKEVNK